jgi:hypothetical protein
VVVKEQFVYIPREEPLLDHVAWDRVRDLLESGTNEDELVSLLREYAEQAALYLARGLVRRPETATGREWFAAATSTVATIAAAHKMRPRNAEELLQRARALENGYLRLTALLLAWAAVTERRQAQQSA